MIKIEPRILERSNKASTLMIFWGQKNREFRLCSSPSLSASPRFFIYILTHETNIKDVTPFFFKTLLALYGSKVLMISIQYSVFIAQFYLALITEKKNNCPGPVYRRSRCERVLTQWRRRRTEKRGAAG